MAVLSKTKYEVLREFVGPDVRQLVYDYTVLKRDTGQMRAPDARIADAPRLYADPITESLLAEKLDAVEAAVGARLFPTYSYLRIHQHGARMESHRDRSASEIGVTINFGGDARWPIWLRPDAADLAIDLAPGDALLYLGREVPHWREPFGGTVQVQAMLFYVRQHGDFARYAYDGRPGLGFAS